jgi:hypothetical protein
MQSEQIIKATADRARINATNAEAIFSFGALSVRERDFVSCLFKLAERPAFTGLTEKQSAWLSDIDRKLKAVKSRRTRRASRRARAYAGTCMSW